MPATDLARFTHVFRADINRPRRVIHRAREPLSCQQCRIRKLKCDRQQPVCGSCFKRGDKGSCNYSSTPLRGDGNSLESAEYGRSTRSRRGPRSRQEVHSRLQELEELVNGLLSKRSVTSGHVVAPTPESLSSTDNLAASAGPDASHLHTPDAASAATGGHISRNGIEMPFIGATHWAAILESIHDIRDCLEVGEGDHNNAPRPSEPRIADKLDPLFGITGSITIRAVMAALPSRLKTDKLLGVYDKSRFTSAAVLHAQQFRRQYESFWLAPASTSFLWISILFSTLAMAVLDDIPHVGEEAAFAQQRFYTTKAMQCLVAGEYFKAKPMAVEALIMYTLVRVSESKHSDPYLWSFFSVAVRLAQRMGYHRDPSQLNSARITPFQAEMRRRSWFLLEAFDLMYSMQLGMPTVIQDDQCDVGSPTNLHDEDFDEDSISLLPGRPDTEPTKALYFTYKSRLIRQMRRIVLHALSVRTRDYAETLALHADLETIHDNIPPPLRIPSVRGSVGAVAMVQANTNLHRVTLELMYLKALCILHRPYLARRKTDPTCEVSRQSCRQAALRILELHSDIEVEVGPSGRLFERGYLLGTLSLHDFLVAAMVLCLDLNETAGLSAEDREVELLALRVAYSNWSSRASTSKDAAHAKKVLGAMLRKVSKPDAANQRDAPLSPAMASQSSARVRPHQPNREMPWVDHDYESAPAAPFTPRVPAVLREFLRQENETLGFKNQGLLSTMKYLDFSDVTTETLDFFGEDDMGKLFDSPNEIDWNMVDSYLLDRNGGTEIATEDPVVQCPVDSQPVPNFVQKTLYMHDQPWSPLG